MKLKLKFEHNDRVRDVNTGYHGRINRVNYDFDTKAIQYCVEGIDSTGRPEEWWVLEQNLEAYDPEKVMNEAVESVSSFIDKLEEYL